MFSKRKRNKIFSRSENYSINVVLKKEDEQNSGKRQVKSLGQKISDVLGKTNNTSAEPAHLPQMSEEKELPCSSSTWEYSWNWLSHQGDYTVLLSQLQQQHLTQMETQPCDNSTSVVIDLEKKAKKSRKRVHYQRSIQGKNMKNCSQADWNCILGIKRRKKNLPEEADSTVDVNQYPDNFFPSSEMSNSQFLEKSIENEPSNSIHPKEEAEMDIPGDDSSVVDNEQQNVAITSYSKTGKNRKRRKRKKTKKNISCLKMETSQTDDEFLEETANGRTEKENQWNADDSLIILRKAKKMKKKKKRAELKAILDLNNSVQHSATCNEINQLTEGVSLESENETTKSTCRGILKATSEVGNTVKPAQKKCVTFLDKPIVGYVPAKDSIRGGAWIWRTKSKKGKVTIV